MTGFYIFIIRVILSVVFAVVLMRIFFPDKHPLYMAALAVFLIAASYFSAYLRRRK